MQPLIFVNNEYIYQIVASEADELLVRKYTLDINLRRFIEVRNYLWKCKSTSQIQVLAADSVKEVVTGLDLPVILVSLSDESEESVKKACFILCVEAEQIVVLKKLKLAQDEYHNAIRLISGPGLLIHSKTGINVYKSSHLNIYQDSKLQYSLLELTCHNVCCKQQQPGHCKKVNYIDIYTKLNEQFVFTVMTLKCSCVKHKKHLVRTVNVCQIHNDTLKKLTTDHFIPQEYLSNITSICVEEVTCDNAGVFSSKMYIGTAEGFVSHITNGNVINCVTLSNTGLDIDLSYEKCISSIIYDAEAGRNQTADKVLICQEKVSKWMVLDKELQVERAYTDNYGVLVGDFAKCGSHQFLFLKDWDLENRQWFLTDLSAFHLDSKDGESCEEIQDEVTKNTNAVLQALQSRLQKETLCATEQRQLCQQRAEFVQEMCARCSPDRHQPRPHQTSQQVGACLVPLVTCHTRRGHWRSHLQDDVPLVDIQEVWHRTVRGHWCIGADVLNKSGRDLQMTLEVVLNSGADSKSVRSVHTKLSASPSQGQVLPKSDNNRLLDSDLNHEGSGSKRTRLDSVSSVVCAATPIPDFCVSGRCSASVLLHLSAVEQPSTGGTGEPGTHGMEAGDQQTWLVPCGELTLSSRDVVQGKHDVKLGQCHLMDGDLQQLKELQRDQLAMRQTQILNQLSVRSSPGILSDLSTLLTERCGFIYTGALDCYTSQLQGLDCVQLNLAPVWDRGSRDVDIYTSNERELYLVVHHLYSCLPDHVLIVPRDTSSSKQQQTLCSSMAREIQSLANSLTNLLSKHESQTAKCDTDNSVDEDSVRKVGEKFKINRERLKEKQAESLGRSETKELARTMQESKQRTDVVFSCMGSS